MSAEDMSGSPAACAGETEAVPASAVPFAELCALLERLHKKKQDRPEQDRLLTAFFDDFRLKAAAVTGRKNCSLFPVMRLLLPALDRERGAYRLKEAALGATLARVLALAPSSDDALRLTSYRSVGNAQDSDLAGVAYFVLKNRLARQPGTLTVKDVNDVLDKIANAQVGGKARVLDEAFGAVLRQLSAEQLKWFLRIVLKDLRLRVGHARLLAAMHPDAPEFYDSCSNLLKTCSELEPGSARPLELGVQLFCAVSPMLSERLDVTRVLRLPPADYVVEDKFDGERFQLHMQDGVFEYFSRKGHSYGQHYGTGDGRGLLTPRLRQGLAPGITSLVLDGEMMGWHKQRQVFGSKGMSFDVKKITENSSFQPCFCAFDVLQYNGRSLAGPAGAGGAPLRARLALLDAAVSDVPGALLRSRRRAVPELSGILEALNRAMEEQEEGIVVKDLDSYYLPNRRNAGWYKVKPEYTEGTMVELDLVVVGAEEASDKRRGRARSFHVACADGEPGAPHRWVVVGRVATGLTFEQREALCAALERHWVPSKTAPPPACLVFNKEKPDFWVMPEHSVILQVRATELIRSTDFGTSHTLRFPRVTAVRDDKPTADAMPLAEFNALVADGSVVKLSKRRVAEAALEPGGAARGRKRAAPALQVPAHLRAQPEGDVEVVSAALKGREICVVSGDEASSKAELVRLVRAHGGNHVENVGPSTWCCVAGRKVLRAHAARARDVDVAAAAWLRALPPGGSPAELTPLDLLTASRATRMNLCHRYDRFGDSYTEPTDEETLRRCFAKMDEEPPIHLTRTEMLALDRELFGDQHPLSFLRNCALHFPPSPTPSAAPTVARMYGARVVGVGPHEPGLTHVLLPRGARAGAAARGRGLAVSERWLDECVRERKYVSEKPFLFDTVDLYVP